MVPWPEDGKPIVIKLPGMEESIIIPIWGIGNDIVIMPMPINIIIIPLP